MARGDVYQRLFTGGELGPSAIARDDLNKYLTCVAAPFQNFTPKLEGPALRRSGTRFVAEVKDSTRRTRVVPFVFSTTQAYVLEFGHLYVRIYLNEGRLEDPPGTPVEVVTTYDETKLFTLQFAQSADTLYIVHPMHPPAKLTRTSALVWTLDDVVLFDGPYDAENTTTVTLTPSGTTGSITITSSSAGNPNWTAGRDEGRLVRIRAGDKWGCAVIDSVTSPTVVDATVQRDFAAASAATRWRLGTWYGSSEPNWPAALTFHNQRLVFAADPEHPQTFYGSVNGDFEAFSPTGSILRNEDIFEDTGGAGDDINDDNAYVYALASDQVNVIQWLNSTRSLVIGTVGGTWPAQASQQLEAITPLNIAVQRTSDKGSMALQAVAVGTGVFYVGRSRRRAWYGQYDLSSDAFLPENVSILNEQLLQASPIVALAYASEPLSTVWCVRTDGVLLGFTIDVRQEIAGWHRHVMGGSFAGGDAVVESVAVIPATSGSVTPGAHENIDHDQLWLVVKRTINGATVRYLEFMEDAWRDDVALEDAFMVDCGLTYSGAAATTISGLDHLIGETVEILADGSRHPPKIVDASGEVLLDRSASKVQLGLGYVSRLRTLPLPAPDFGGSSRGKIKRTDHVTLLFHRSLGGEISKRPDLSTFEPLRLWNVSLGDPPEVFSGEIDSALSCGWNTTAQLEIRQADPYPMELLGIVHRVASSGQGL